MTRPTTLGRWALTAFLAGQLLASTNVVAAKLQADLTQPGLRARSEAPIPVEVRFKWDGIQILEGKLEIELHDGERVLGRFRSGDLALTTGEQRFQMLLPPCAAPPSGSQVEARMKFITTAGDEIELDPSSLFVPAFGERSLALAWCNARTAMAAPDFEQTMLFEHFAPESSNAGGKLALTSLVRLTPEDLPAQPLSYTAFDMVVLSADAFSEAGDGRLRALARWVKGGGSVCVFVNGGLQSHHLSFLNELAGSVSDAPTFLADNNGYLLPGDKEIWQLRPGLGRSVIITGNIPPASSPEWRKAVAFLWKFRETRAQAIAETAHWESATDDSGETAPISIEQYTTQFQNLRRPNRPMPISMRLESIDAAVGLTDEQKPKVKAALDAWNAARQQAGNLASPQRVTDIQAAYNALDAKMKDILTADQYKKFQAGSSPGRFMVRPGGISMMDSESIAKAVGLTDDEKSKVKAAVDQWTAAWQAALSAPVPQRRNELRAAMQVFDLKMKSILTPAKYAKYQTLRTPRVVQPFNNGIYSTSLFSYGVQDSMLASQLMAPLLPKTVRLIPFPALLALLGLFLLAIGPGDYFVLGSLRRRRFTWVLFPALSFGFMLATVLMANHFLGARDERRSLIVVDLDKDGAALCWSRYDLIFAGADKQAVTELKDALWVPMNSGPTPYYPGGMPPVGYSGNPQYANLYRRSYMETETGPPLYEGNVPTHFQTTELVHQWQPRLNRIFSFEPPPVPLLPNWREVEAAWPDLPAIRAKLSARKGFDGDVCAISNSVPSLSHAAASGGIALEGPSGLSSPGTTGLLGQLALERYEAQFDSGSSQILPPSILSELCLGGSAGLRSVVSQISPNGGGSSEDVPAMDTEAGDSALVIVTQSGDNIIVYRRFFHGS